MLLMQLVHQLCIVMFVVWSGREVKELPCVVCRLPCINIALLLFVAVNIYRTVSIGQLLLLPHATSNSSVVNVTHRLLDCLESDVSAEDLSALKRCTEAVTVYDVPQSRMPVVAKMPVAFVLPYVYDNEIFMVRPYYDEQSLTNKALTVIHECTHLALDTYDLAYRWEPIFHGLTEQEHAYNADSYVNIIVNKCLNGIDVF